MPRTSIRPWLLAESNLADVRAANFQVALLPMGATEPHNLHLPYATDSIEATQLASACCEKALELGGQIVQLPTIPYGTETNMHAFPLAMNLMPSTVSLVLRDLVHSIEASGIHKLVIFNSHGGNDLKPFLREIAGQTKVHVFLCNWYQMETSLIMHFRPELVAKSESGQLLADSGDRSPLRFEALRKSWVTLSRPWHLLTTNSGSGNPHLATADKGRLLTEEVVARIAPFLAELSASELDSSFPFEPKVT
jgi:creatinine amidohydrolase